jgi:hypothetical protein
MDEEQIRLECLILVWPKNEPNADVPHYVAKAQELFEYVTGTRQTTKADKPKGPAKSV